MLTLGQKMHGEVPIAGKKTTAARTFLQQLSPACHFHRSCHVFVRFAVCVCVCVCVPAAIYRPGMKPQFAAGDEDDGTFLELTRVCRTVVCYRVLRHHHRG